MSAENSKAGSWGQLMVTPGTQAGQQRALPLDIETHIRAITAPDAEALPIDTERWFRAVVREYATCGRRLDEVMGLAPVSAKRDWRTMDRDEARNAWLIRAFHLLGGTGSEYSRCRKLSDHIYLFEEANWPKLENCNMPPDDMTPFRQALFFAFKFGAGEVPHGWKRLMEIVQRPPTAPETCSILWHIHAATYDQSRSNTPIGSLNYIGRLHMNTIEKLALLTLHAWEGSPELRERHQYDLTDYHERMLRQAMDCDVDEGEFPALITDVLSREQIANALQLTGVKSI